MLVKQMLWAHRLNGEIGAKGRDLSYVTLVTIAQIVIATMH